MIPPWTVRVAKHGQMLRRGIVAQCKKTRLHEWHKDHAARMMPFAGWDMPVQYEGLVNEHLHTRKHASLFDVSHMGQLRFHGADRIRFVEWVTCADIQSLKVDRGRLTVSLNEQGGVRDDMIVTRCENHVAAVVNASRAAVDIAYFAEKVSEFGGDVQMEIDGSSSLVALQGPDANTVLRRYDDTIDSLPYMGSRHIKVDGIPAHVMRCGYTGEDGFEIALKHVDVKPFAELMLSNTEVKAAGLGARNSLRVESGLCLYGHELREDLTLFESSLTWIITKRRMAEGGFIGYERCKELASNPELVPRKRIGITSTGICAREGAKVLVGDEVVGEVTSGCPSPCRKCNVAQALLAMPHTKDGTQVSLDVRGKRVPGVVTKLPFVETRYKIANKAPPPAAAP